MQKNLVIVESPQKAKMLEKFLGEDYKVMSSKGHVRDLKKTGFGIDMNTLELNYVVPDEQKALVQSLKSAAAKSETVWLASDEDREGEAISWHLAQVLGLDIESTKRIVFHEITKTAILEAIEHPRTIDINLVNAQQARRVLDRIVGFKLSPVLWRKLKSHLSAGRVQSVTLRLIVEREKEIHNFKSESNYKVDAIFLVNSENNTPVELKASLSTRFNTEAEAKAFLQSLEGKEFSISEISKKPMKKCPAPPFTTSTLQQEAARKLGYTVSQTMVLAQRLYESGLITYMRTDSVNLSKLCLAASREEIINSLGEQYAKTRNYHTNSKGAQEAHEAIRPTFMDNHEITGTQQERRLYELIWKRTLASQMADADIEKTTIKINISGEELEFVATGEVVVFDGFLHLYKESIEDESDSENENELLPAVAEGQIITYKDVTATERFTQPPLRYTEASMVRKLEELGIGRPSTYAPTISTIKQRGYVEVGNVSSEKHKYKILHLSNGHIAESVKTEAGGKESTKLIPTDIGTVVTEFLEQYFPDIVEYNFTAEVEKQFDDIAEGNIDWKKVITDFYEEFSPTIENSMKDKAKHKVGERCLGTDPESGKEVIVKIGRYGPVVQIGSADDEEKPRFAQLNKGQSIQTITFEEAMDLFKWPRKVGDYKGSPLMVGVGKWGAYVYHEGEYTTLPSKLNPSDVTKDEAIHFIEEKKKQAKWRHVKAFQESADMEIRHGRYGHYILYKGANYKIAKSVKKPEELTYEQCLDIVKAQTSKTEAARTRHPRSAKKA